MAGAAPEVVCCAVSAVACPAAAGAPAVSRGGDGSRGGQRGGQAAALRTWTNHLPY